MARPEDAIAPPAGAGAEPRPPQAASGNVQAGGGREAWPDLRVARGHDGLEGLREAWNELAATLPDPGFHHQHDWHASHLRHLEADPDAVHFFAFFRGARAVAIFPLRHVRRVVARVSLRAWELPSSEHMTLGDALIGPGEDARALLRVLARRLADGTVARADALHFPNLLADTPLAGALGAGALPRTSLLSSRTSMHFDCADLATALRNGTGEFQRNLRRQRRKLEQKGRLEFSVARAPAEVEAALPRFLEVEASGWKGAAGEDTAIRQDPRLLGFYTDVAGRFARRGHCTINELRLDGVPIAAHFTVVAGRTMYLLKIAYDERHRAEAPGNQLLREVLAYCGGAAAFDRVSLVTGPDWARHRWNPEQRTLYDASAFAASAPGLLAWGVRSLRPVALPVRQALHDLVHREHVA